MEEALKTRLMTELGLNEEQVQKLGNEGVVSSGDLELLSAEEIKALTGCGLITAKKIAQAFKVQVTVPTATVATEAIDPNTEIPENTKPSKEQINSFATGIGMDPNMLMMVLMGNMSAGTGMEMDLSSMMPIPGIVQGYNPKLRNIPYMVMGQIENRLKTPIVVINNNGSINHELTVKYIMSLEEGFEAAENNVYYDEAGQPFQVIGVGVDAQSIYDADPLEPTRALAQNGMGVGRIKWKGTLLEVRQVAFLAVKETNEIDPKNDAHCTWLRDNIKPDSKYLVFQGLAPRAITAYNEGLRTGSLPTLRVMLNRTARKNEVMPRRRALRNVLPAGIGRERGENEETTL